MCWISTCEPPLLPGCTQTWLHFFLALDIEADMHCDVVRIRIKEEQWKVDYKIVPLMSDEGFEIKSGNDYHQDVVDVSAYVPPACSSAQLKLKFTGKECVSDCLNSLSDLAPPPPMAGSQYTLSLRLPVSTDQTSFHCLWLCMSWSNTLHSFIFRGKVCLTWSASQCPAWPPTQRASAMAWGLYSDTGRRHIEWVSREED